MRVFFAEQEWELHPSGALFWPAEKMLVVSDLHLEKGSSFVQRGYFLPPYDSADTLRRLQNVIAHFQPEKLLFLGDSFHDAHGYARLHADTHALFHHVLRTPTIWIHGNHEKGFVPEGVSPYDCFELNNIAFCHEATSLARFEISGHYHPKVAIVHKSARVMTRCFVEDGERFIMPAFGAYTGGLFVTEHPLSQVLKMPANIYALSQKRVTKLPLVR